MTEKTMSCDWITTHGLFFCEDLGKDANGLAKIIIVK